MTRRSRPLQIDVTDDDREDIRSLGDELWNMELDRARALARRPVNEKDEYKRYRILREQADALKMQLHLIRELAVCRAEAILPKGHNTKDEVSDPRQCSDRGRPRADPGGGGRAGCGR